MSRDSVDYLPLLNSPKESVEYTDEEKANQSMRGASRKRKIVHAIIGISLLLNLTFIGGLIWLWRHHWNIHSSTVPWRGVKPLYSPLDDYVEHIHTVGTNLIGRSKWHGPPNDEVDANWAHLYDVGIATIPKEQGERVANQTDKFPRESDQYMVSFDVFHQLHCLDVLRKTFWPSRYPNDQQEGRYENITTEREALFQNTVHGPVVFDHIDHCINVIREGLMCASDVTPAVWRWDPEKKWTYPRFDSYHTCRNFDALRERTGEIMVDLQFSKAKHAATDLKFPAEEY